MENLNSLPTLEREPYLIESNHNQRKIQELFNKLFPDLLTPPEYVYEILKFLEETQVNARVLPQIIRGIHNLVIGTGRGQVIVHVQKETMNVQIREQEEELKTKI